MTHRATDNEVQLLNHIDELSAAMSAAIDAGDGEAFLDALEESQFTERRLCASRDHTWAVWFAQTRNVEGFAA